MGEKVGTVVTEEQDLQKIVLKKERDENTQRPLSFHRSSPVSLRNHLKASPPPHKKYSLIVMVCPYDLVFDKHVSNGKNNTNKHNQAS